MSRAAFDQALGAIRHEVDVLRGEVSRLAERIERGSTTAIRADLDALTGRVEGLGGSMRRQFGKLYAERTPLADGAAAGTMGSEGESSEIDNLLEFQRRWNAGEGTN